MLQPTTRDTEVEIDKESIDIKPTKTIYLSGDHESVLSRAP